MPKRLTLADYQEEAAAKNLDFIGEIYDEDVRQQLESDPDYIVEGPIPEYTTAPTWWRCKLTGKLMYKRLSSIQRGTHGSRYQRDFYETLRKYQKLAQSLEIEFLYNPATEFFPATTKDKCRWRGADGEIVVASYRDLGYGFIKEENIERLGLEDSYV
jgi:hypothetical protein